MHSDAWNEPQWGESQGVTPRGEGEGTIQFYQGGRKNPILANNKLSCCYNRDFPMSIFLDQDGCQLPGSQILLGINEFVCQQTPDTTPGGGYTRLEPGNVMNCQPNPAPRRQKRLGWSHLWPHIESVQVPKGGGMQAPTPEVTLHEPAEREMHAHPETMHLAWITKVEQQFWLIQEQT